MPAPLRTFMVVLWTLCIAGTLAIIFMSVGWVTWQAFAVAGIVGVITGIPTGIWTARKIKRDDPDWPPQPDRPRR